MQQDGTLMSGTTKPSLIAVKEAPWNRALAALLWGCVVEGTTTRKEAVRDTSTKPHTPFPLPCFTHLSGTVEPGCSQILDSKGEGRKLDPPSPSGYHHSVCPTMPDSQENGYRHSLGGSTGYQWAGSLQLSEV